MMAVHTIREMSAAVRADYLALPPLGVSYAVAGLISVDVA